MVDLSSIFVDLAPAVKFGWGGRFFVFLLLVIAPFLAILQPDASERQLPPRSALYASAVVGIGILVALMAVVLWVEGVSPARIGLHAGSARSFAAWTLVTTVGALAGDLLITRGATKMGLRESRLTYHLMPRSRRELLAFAGVSVSAAFGEEATYHGFLLAGLAGWLGSGWLAAVAANLAFGMLHAYQGHAGTVRAFVMGYLFCLPVVTGAGLWPAIAGHFLVNVSLGLGLWRLMVPPDRRAPRA